MNIIRHTAEKCARMPIFKDTPMNPFIMPLRAVSGAVVAAALLIAGSAAAQNSERDPSAIVATVNGEGISFGEVVHFFGTLQPQFQALGLERVYPQVLDRLVEQRLVLQAAEAAGTQNDPEYLRSLQFVGNSLLEQRYLDLLFEAQIDAGSLQAAYDAFEAPSETKASHILVETEDEAKAIIAELDGGADFAALAKEKSTGPSGPNGGDLGFFTKDRMVEPFSVAAFAMEPGTHSEAPVKTRFGWHVIQVTDRRSAEKPSFAEMEEALTLQVQEAVLAGQLEKLRAGAQIETQPLAGQ